MKDFEKESPNEKIREIRFNYFQKKRKAKLG